MKSMRNVVAFGVIALALGACRAASREPETATVVLPPPSEPPPTVALAEAGAAIDAEGCARALAADGAWSADPTHVYVTRRFIDEAFESGNVASSARVVPVVDGDGGVAGMRLFGVRGGGPLDRFGFRNGDVVSTVNGKLLNSPESALDAYSAARDAHTIVVGVMRAGAHADQIIDVCD